MAKPSWFTTLFGDGHPALDRIWATLSQMGLAEGTVASQSAAPPAAAAAPPADASAEIGSPPAESLTAADVAEQAQMVRLFLTAMLGDHHYFTLAGGSSSAAIDRPSVQAVFEPLRALFQDYIIQWEASHTAPGAARAADEPASIAPDGAAALTALLQSTDAPAGAPAAAFASDADGHGAVDVAAMMVLAASALHLPVDLTPPNILGN